MLKLLQSRNIILGILIAIAIAIPAIHKRFQGTVVLEHKALLSVPWPSEINFSGESVPLDQFYVREMWERDFLILLNQDYQNILYLKRSQKYFPYIESQLKKRSMPDDLKYLAVAESGLIETSLSSAGAKGIWQFIPGTAKDQGLVIDEFIDERMHFQKATNAALDYLTDLHEKFGSWTLAAAAYNAGHNRINQRLVAQEIDNYYDLYLNKETSRYLFRILAIKQIMSDPVSYGYELKPGDYFTFPNYKTHTLIGPVEDVAVWAKSEGSSFRILKELNPWISGDSLPEGKWEVRLSRR